LTTRTLPLHENRRVSPSKLRWSAPVCREHTGSPKMVAQGTCTTWVKCPMFSATAPRTISESGPPRRQQKGAHNNDSRPHPAEDRCRCAALGRRRDGRSGLGRRRRRCQTHRPASVVPRGLHAISDRPVAGATHWTVPFNGKLPSGVWDGDNPPGPVAQVPDYPGL
jgi:hypothetical protein